MQRTWEHERTIAPEDGGTRVTDRVTFVPRLPGAGRVAEPIVRRVFTHRHDRLRSAFQ